MGGSHGFEDAGAGSYGGAGGVDIVNEDDVFRELSATAGPVSLWGIGGQGVAPAFAGREECLAAGFDGVAHQGGVDR